MRTHCWGLATLDPSHPLRFLPAEFFKLLKEEIIRLSDESFTLLRMSELKQQLEMTLPERAPEGVSWPRKQQLLNADQGLLWTRRNPGPGRAGKKKGRKMGNANGEITESARFPEKVWSSRHSFGCVKKRVSKFGRFLTHAPFPSRCASSSRQQD